jgi:uncharacterized protein YukJ
MAHRRHGHGGGQHGGSHHGVPNYGVVKGRPAEEKVFPPSNPSDQPHLHIKIDGGGAFFDVAVNILSQDNSEVLFRVDSHFSPTKAADLLALPDGATTIGSDHPNGLGLDYLRQHLTTRDAMMLLPIDPDNLDTDLHDSLSNLVQSVIDDPDATLFAFGSQFHDNNESPFWHFSPDAGIHDIHMNQGNPPGNHDQDNGTFQDGGLLAFFPSTGQWSAVFIAFQSQEFTNVDDQGNLSTTRAASRLVVTRPRPLTLASPADFHARFDSLQMAHIQGSLHQIPTPRRDPPVMSLDEVIGATDVAAITASGQIVFHSVGDTGKGEHSAQTDVATAMAADFDRPNPADRPAFYFHLGDVIYGHDKDVLYREQFYTPFSQYPGRIIAIPGNHDGETFPKTDPVSCKAFQENFCADAATIPVIAGSAMRETMTQPAVYFLLEAPFIRIIGLYSNAAENPGFISGPTIGDSQKQFLVDQLKDIARKRTDGDTSALVIAMHHPPYSGGGHAGSREMLADIEDAIKQAGAAPDMVLSGHSHNYQRFTRQFMLKGQGIEMPFIVAGGGGHGLTPLKLARGHDPVATPLAGQSGDVSLRQYFNGFGYLYITVTSRVLDMEFHPVHDEDLDPGQPLDRVTVDLKTRRIRFETPPLTHPVSGEPKGHRSVEGDDL